MARRKGGHRSLSTVSVRLDLPTDIDVPRRLPLAPPMELVTRTRARSVPLVRRSSVPFVRRRVQIMVPNFITRPRPSVVMTRPGKLKVWSYRKAQRLLSREDNRRRRFERKTRRTKAHHGQLTSVRSDPFGIIAHAVNRGRSARAISDAAMVSRALQRFWRR